MITYKVRSTTGSILKEKLARLNAKEFANIIRDDIKDNIEKSRNADNTRMTPLKAKTIETKKKQGGIAPRKPLIFKGGTQKGIQSQTLTQKEAIVVSSGSAKGYYRGQTPSIDVLKYQIKKGRDPFGISDRAIRAIRKRIKELFIG